MPLEVRLHPVARADLFGLYDFIADRFGFERADGYVARIEQVLRALGDHPERGRQRSDIAPGLRTIPLERRVLIAYRIDPDGVTVLRILYAGRDFGTDDLPG